MALAASPRSPEADVSSSPRLALGALIHTSVSGVLAGAVAGAIAGGLGGRLAMRISAIMATDAEQGSLTDAGERVGHITLDGTLELVFFGGIFSGVLGGLIFAATPRWFGDAGRARGALFGMFLVATLGWGVIEGDNLDFATFGAVTVNLAMFAAIFLLFGVLVVPLFDWMRSVLSPPGLHFAGLVALSAYALGTVMIVGILGTVGAGFGAEGSERWFFTIIPAYVIVAMPLAAMLISRRRPFDRLSDLKDDAAMMWLAFAVIAAPVVLGIALDLQALAQILSDAYETPPASATSP